MDTEEVLIIHGMAHFRCVDVPGDGFGHRCRLWAEDESTLTLVESRSHIASGRRRTAAPHQALRQVEASWSVSYSVPLVADPSL